MPEVPGDIEIARDMTIDHVHNGVRSYPLAAPLHVEAGTRLTIAIDTDTQTAKVFGDGLLLATSERGISRAARLTVSASQPPNRWAAFTEDELDQVRQGCNGDLHREVRAELERRRQA